MAGTELAKAYVQIIPSAAGIKGKLSGVLGGEASAAGDAAGRIAGNNLSSILKKTIAAAGIGAALKSALTEGANLQQSLGGIETLFKDSADKVIENAKKAYMTAGLSANEYMESVTSFSASLLQGLSGDTNKAADVADMALTDMADNANKMGTSMELIQNAYQGFAKQNYTMLDNLKLGYGGTKTEMERLLADATKLSGVKYQLDNLSDVYEAIHVIQEEMDITGTTAKEAASTFSGSMARMSAAFKNVLGNLALGEDIGPAMNGLIDSASVFLKDNLLPMVGNVFMAIPEVFEGLGDMVTEFLADADYEGVILWAETLIENLIVSIISQVPRVIEAAAAFVSGFGDAIVNTDWLEVATGFLEKLRDAMLIGIGEYFGADDEMITGMFGFLIEGLPVIAKLIQNAFGIIWEFCQTIWEEAGLPIFEAVQEVFLLLFGVLEEKFPEIQNFVKTCFSNIAVFWEKNLKPCLSAIGDFIQKILLPVFVNVFKGTISPLIDTVFNFIKSLWEGTLKPVFTGITDFLTGVFTLNFEQAWNGILSILKGIINSMISSIETFINGAISALNGLLEGLNGIANDVGEILGFDVTIPTIPLISLPRLAKGGVLEKGQLGLLEGSGAEAVVPLENNEKWIAAVARDMNETNGNNAILLQILEILLELRDEMPEEMIRILAQLRIVIGEREFGRLVKAVLG